MTQAAKARYMAEVDEALIRQLKIREKMLDQIGKMVDQFDEENPEATYEDLLIAFGPAPKLVEEMLSTLPREQVEEAKKKNALQHRVIQVAVALVLAVTAVFFFWRWQKTQEVVNGDFKVAIAPAEELTDEEMEALMKATPSDAQSVDGGT